MIGGITERVLAGASVSKDDALSLASLEGTALYDLFASAGRIREEFRKNGVDLCSIVNAKSGACSEDCSYCAQSSKSSADIGVYPLIKKDRVIEKAREAKEAGVRRFCIVTSGRRVGKDELRNIAAMIEDVRTIGLLPCATLGMLNRDDLSLLKDSGLERYHHNLETSERHFPEICRTHTYSDKVRTIEAAKSAGLSVCSGGIFGIGETWHDRVDMAYALRELDVNSVPINFLIAVKGTPLEHADALRPFEALKIISIFRFILPDKEVRVCGGRRQVLGEFNAMVFMAGADAILTGNYLTTTGTTYEDDVRLIGQYGLQIR